MAKASALGEYAAQAIITPTESASNTLTFEKLEAGISIYDRVGWVINRIETRITAATLALFNGTGDFLSVALTASNQITSLNEDNPSVYAMRRWVRLDFGTAASASIGQQTFVDDYSTLPGGGLLVLPTPLYAGIVGSGLTGPASAYVKLFFKAIELSAEDYFNLTQTRQLLINS